jgi:hypothetical protein
MPMSDFQYRAKRLGLQKFADLHDELEAAICRRDAMKESGDNFKWLDLIIKDIEQEIDEESKKLD